MKMSTKGRYGLRVMMELVANYGCGPMPAEDIAKNHGISGNYIHILVASLRAAGLVRAVRGPGGGYELARDPSGITVLDVVSALEGRIAPVDCNSDVLPHTQTTRRTAQDVWLGVVSAMDDVLSGITLESLDLKQHTKRDKPMG